MIVRLRRFRPKALQLCVWALIAFLIVLVLALAGCKPIVFDGPPQPRKEQLALTAGALCLIAVAVVQWPLAKRDRRCQAEEQREKQRQRLERLKHAG